MEHVAWTTSIIDSMISKSSCRSDCTPYKTSQDFVILAKLKVSLTIWSSSLSEHLQERHGRADVCVGKTQKSPKVAVFVWDSETPCQPFLEAKNNFKVLVGEKICFGCFYFIFQCIGHGLQWFLNFWWQGMSINCRLIMQLWIIHMTRLRNSWRKIMSQFLWIRPTNDFPDLWNIG